jgi:hypothetical protein
MFGNVTFSSHAGGFVTARGSPIIKNNIDINMLNLINFSDIHDELKPVFKALPVFDQHYRQKSDS